jgi:hypothetical protein
MRVGRHAVGSLIAAALLINALPATATAQKDQPVALAGNVEPALDASGGQVEIAAIGSANGSVVPVIVRNATDSTVKVVQVTMAKPGPNGAPVTHTGAAFVPGVLAPGALAIGGVDFDTPDAALLPTASAEVESRPAGRGSRSTDLTVRNVRQVAPTSVAGLPSFRMQLVNRTGRVVKGPIAITIMCFGESSRPTGVFTSSVDRGRLRRNAKLQAQVELATLCPAYLVGAQGRGPA